MMVALLLVASGHIKKRMGSVIVGEKMQTYVEGDRYEVGSWKQALFCMEKVAVC